MIINDFQYDDLTLSEMGFMVCTFGGSSGLEIISSGAQLSFNTVSVYNGELKELITSQYDDTLQFTFQICKKACDNLDVEISFAEYRDLMSWLHRKSYHKLKILNDEYLDLYFEGSFNVSRIEIDNKLIGLELTFISNRPYAMQEEHSISLDFNAGETKIISTMSDEEGIIYPKMTIVLRDSGNLILENNRDNEKMYIANCLGGEIINIEYPIITTNKNAHEISKDFNWSFLKLFSTFYNKQNAIKPSLKCNITFTFSSRVKIGI